MNGIVAPADGGRHNYLNKNANDINMKPLNLPTVDSIPEKIQINIKLYKINIVKCEANYIITSLQLLLQFLEKNNGIRVHENK